MKNRTVIFLIFISFLVEGRCMVFAVENTVDPRETAIDRAIGGMVEGSRPLPSQHEAAKKQIHQVSGGGLSPAMDTRVTAYAGAPSPSPNVVGTGNAGANLGGNTNVGTETGGSDQGVTGGGTTVGTETTVIPEPVTAPVTEPESGGSANDSIIHADANVDLSGESPAVDANLAVDTNADTLLDVNASTTTDVTSTDTTVTESATVAGEDLTAPINEAFVDATLETEIVATDIPTDSEATAGLEADVDPVTADSDVTLTDPADGLVI